MRRRWRRMPVEVRREVMRLAAEGCTYSQILEEVDISEGGITCVLRPLGGVIRKESLGGGTGRRLSVTDRHRIWLGLGAGESFRSIARELGRAPSTVSREVDNNGGREGYRPHAAQERAYQLAKRPKPRKLEEDPDLWTVVEKWLKRLWSPEQISGRLVKDFPDDETMRVSPETIYKSVYVQGRGALRKELAACLRTGRAKRKPQGRMEKRGKIDGMVMISERPAEVEDRAVPGHWEGDLVMGAGNRSAIGTLVERTTRYVMLLHLPRGRDAAQVREAMTQKIQTLPEKLRGSVTWDQGKEMTQHLQFSVDTGVDIYFCDPHSPWQRGSNENTNGLIRQYFPKGTDLSKVTEAELDAAADSLNGRPRQTLDWMTPSEKLAEIIVASTG
ncbi:MAG: IS30 family transposase [Acidimicrobiia bacterium]|nr:IS30 family transposase [Acidimicrobiia bacterium]